MTTPDPFGSSFAWCLYIDADTPIRAATTDLWEDAAVATLGGFYTKRIVDTENARVISQLPNLFYGITAPDAATFTLDNSDNLFSPAVEWRLTAVTLYHYDRINDVKVTDFDGIISAIQFLNTRVVLTISSHDAALLNTMLPVAVIDPQESSPFETSATPGVPLPVVFGDHVPLRPPNAASDTQEHPSTFEPPGNTYIVSFGTVYVEGAYLDTDPAVGLERLGEPVAAPGNPTYVSATVFSTTGAANVDQSQRYLSGTRLRFHTTASGETAWVYSEVATDGFDPVTLRVTIAAALLDSGLNNVQIISDMFVLRGNAYQNITAGILPVPDAPGADFTAVLVSNQDTRLYVFASSPVFPASTTHISTVIEQIFVNQQWGLSAASPQTVDGDSFDTAVVALEAAGLMGAVNGALAFDQQQRRADDVLNELLIMRGMRLRLNGVGNWELKVDALPTSVADFQLGPGDEFGVRIKRMIAHETKPVNQAVKNVILHWQVLGRAQAGTQKFTPREYGRTSTAAASGIGQDLHLYNQWIRTEDIAAKVVYYVAQKLKGADESCTFTAGIEARDVEIGDGITITVPTDGISGSWQVSGISKTLTEITITAIKSLGTEYDSPTGVVHSADPTDTDVRTTPGAGSNLIPNADFSSPALPLPGFHTPHAWATFPAPGSGFGTSLPAWSITNQAMDYSAALLPGCFGGHYFRITWANVPLAPALGTDAPPGLYTDMFAVPKSVRDVFMPSVYCDQADGVWFAIDEIDNTGLTTHDTKFVAITYDPTDTNSLGWGRYYGRTRLKTTTTHVVLLIGVNKSATFQFDAADFRDVGRSARRPPAWARHKPQPLILTASGTATFDNSLNAVVADLIPAGAYVLGVTSRITTAIVFTTISTDGSNSYVIGTGSANPDAWGVHWTGSPPSPVPLTATAVGSVTTSANFRQRNATYYPFATNVAVTANGLVTSGAVRLTVEYTLSGPPSGD